MQAHSIPLNMSWQTFNTASEVIVSSKRLGFTLNTCIHSMSLATGQLGFYFIADMADNSAGAGSPKVGQPPAYAPSVNPWYDRYTCHVDMPMGPPPKTPQYSSRGKVLDSSHGISKGWWIGCCTWDSMNLWRLEVLTCSRSVLSSVDSYLVSQTSAEEPQNLLGRGSHYHAFF